MTCRAGNRRSGALRRAAWAVLIAMPVLLAGSDALADSISFFVSSGHGHGRHLHRHHHHHRFQSFHVHQFWGPPVVVRRTVVVDRPVVVERPVVTPYVQSCTDGLWRYADGTMVEGVACKQPDGSWRMEP